MDTARPHRQTSQPEVMAEVLATQKLQDARQQSAAKLLVYVVDDDRDIANLVRHHLQAAGYVVRIFEDAAKVLPEAEKEQPALFLLDVMLPGENGLQLCRRIRATPSLTDKRILFITAKTGEADRILGLDAGGDDYITKPFSTRELLARVKAVLRPFDSHAEMNPVTVGNITVDSAAMLAKVGDRLVALTITEFRLLEFFIKHVGRVFTREQLLHLVWRESHAVTPRAVDVYVRRVREKIEPDPENPRYLKTIRGSGYRFDDPA